MTDTLIEDNRFHMQFSRCTCLTPSLHGDDVCAVCFLHAAVMFLPCTVYTAAAGPGCSVALASALSLLCLSDSDADCCLLSLLRYYPPSSTSKEKYCPIPILSDTSKYCPILMSFSTTHNH